MEHEKGFTILEVLMGLVILVIATSIVLISLSKLNSSQVLEKNTSLVVSILDEARSLTLSSKDGLQYGVHFEPSSVTLFRGSTYSVSDPNNVVTSLDNRLEIEDITLTGDSSSVVFKRLSGGTDQSGSLEIFLKESPDNRRIISIVGTGVINVTP
jgi:prepilin-type N-terminal cleavage/methylation domain-containing protein